MNSIAKRIGVVFILLFFLVYAGVQAYRMLTTSLETVTVERGIAYETVETTGVVYREETVLQQNPQGYLFYTIENGNRVAKGGTIATVFPTLQDALGQQQLDTLDAEIESLQSINEQGTANRANLSSINQKIGETWLAVTAAAQTDSFTQMNELHHTLLSLLNKRQITVGKESDFDTRLAELRAERNALASSFQKATGVVSSPVAGYFINAVDGFEGTFNTKKVEDTTVEQVEQALQAIPTVSSRDGIGKVVGDYEWYMTCIIPLEQAGSLKKGAVLNMQMPFVLSGTVPVEILAVNKSGDDRAAVVFQCRQMSRELSTIRREQIALQIREYSGLAVPDAALYFNEQQEPGVYVRSGNTIAFRRVKVIYHDETEKQSICEVVDDSKYLQLYDRVVTKGENLYDGKLVR